MFPFFPTLTVKAPKIEQKVQKTAKKEEAGIPRVTARVSNADDKAVMYVNGQEAIKILAENITAQRDGSSSLANLFGGGVKSGLEGILETTKGTPMESTLEKLIKDLEDMKDKRSTKKK